MCLSLSWQTKSYNISYVYYLCISFTLRIDINNSHSTTHLPHLTPTSPTSHIHLSHNPHSTSHNLQPTFPQLAYHDLQPKTYPSHFTSSISTIVVSCDLRRRFAQGDSQWRCSRRWRYGTRVISSGLWFVGWCAVQLGDMYSVQCTLYNRQCTVYNMQCTVYNRQWSVKM